MESVSALSSVPPEIWFKIFDFVLWDEIIFDADPVSSSPQPHLALRSWHDTARLLKIGKQRSVLRRICRTWKDIVDVFSSYHFQALKPGDITIDKSGLQRARRLQLGYQFGRRDGSCCRGYSYWNLLDTQEDRDLNLLADHMTSIGTLRAEILIIPRSEWEALLKKPLDDVRRLLSTVRALLIEYSESIPADIPLVCPNITFLAIHATSMNSNCLRETQLSFPSVSTLQLLINSEEYMYWVAKWEMPSLKYLELATTSQAFEDSLSFFLTNVGQGLISLQLSDAYNPISFAGNIWHVLPRVCYLGSTMLDLANPLPQPPPNHPFQTFSNREHGNYPGWREDLASMAEALRGLQCFSDAHTWDNMVNEFLDLEGQVTPISVHTCDRHNICDKCVHRLYLVCEKRGVRYEDEYGRTWAEYKSVLNRI